MWYRDPITTLCLSVGMGRLGPLDLSSDILYQFSKPDYFPKTTQTDQHSSSFTGIKWGIFLSVKYPVEKGEKNWNKTAQVLS